MGSSSGAARDAAQTLESVQQEYDDVLGLLDNALAARQVAELIPERLGVDLSFVGLTRPDGTTELCAFAGTRTRAAHGLVVRPAEGVGGRVAVLREPFWVADYVSSTSITHSYDIPMTAEDVHGLLAVPVVRGRRLLGLVYAGTRRSARFGDDACNELRRLADRLALAVETGAHAQAKTEAAVQTERRRMALELHDSVGAMLFGIGAAAANIPQTAERDELLARLGSIVDQAAAASAALREALLALDTGPAQVVFAAALQTECSAFEERSGVTAKVVVLGDLPPVPFATSSALVAVVREALLNVAKHAHANAVVISAYERERSLTVVVADDGVGIQPEPTKAGLGIQACIDRMERLGGRLVLTTQDGGGTTLRASVPL